MKPIKLVYLTMAAILALGAYSPKALGSSTTTQNSKLNVSITITTNLPEVVNGTSWKNPVKTVKIGNKQLLDLFANWTGSSRTNEPWKSAQLVIGWDWDNDVLVVDKTGTNVLFDATAGAGAGSANFSVDFFDEYGVGETSGKNANPGFYAAVDTDSADFTLYDDGWYLPYTDISCYGGNKQDAKQNWDKNGSYSTWKDSETARFPSNGYQYFKNFGSDVTSTAKISAEGSGKGVNVVGWAGSDF
jgi:hypothetical protein